MNENETQENWRDNVSSSSEVLKIKDGETKKLVFMNEGKKVSNPDFGNSVLFTVSEDEVEKRFYVKANNFALLGQIKDLGETLVGKVVMVSRKGSKRSDTRYTIKLVE